MMNHDRFNRSLDQLIQYTQSRDFTGYDIYDGLNFTKSEWLLNNYWTNTLITQGFKKFPFNLRPILGMRPVKMPKAVGIFLNSYCNLARYADENNQKEHLLRIATSLKNWLIQNRCRKYSGMSWNFGFNYKFMFDEPTVVITSIIAKGIHNYYSLTGDPEAKEMLLEMGKFIVENLPVTETQDGICFSYTVPVKDCCYNASMLAAETLARVYSITREPALLEKINNAVKFLIAHQQPDGRWNYSINIKTGIERPQVDFHQGYVLESLHEIIRLTNSKDESAHQSLKSGAQFYFSQQFFPDGRAKWRIPVDRPVEIHNQAQGIITFALLSYLDDRYLDFAGTILDWTINNMQDKEGYFYYQKHLLYTNKIPYMRWAQAWMHLAMTTYQCKVYS